MLRVTPKKFCIGPHSLICTRDVCCEIKVNYIIVVKFFFLALHFTMLNNMHSSTFSWCIWYRLPSLKTVGTKFRKIICLGVYIKIYIIIQINMPYFGQCHNMFKHAFTVVHNVFRKRRKDWFYWFSFMQLECLVYM